MGAMRSSRATKHSSTMVHPQRQKSRVRLLASGKCVPLRFFAICDEGCHCASKYHGEVLKRRDSRLGALEELGGVSQPILRACGFTTCVQASIEMAMIARCVFLALTYVL